MVNNNQDDNIKISVSSSDKIARYSSDLLKKGLKLAKLIEQEQSQNKVNIQKDKLKRK